MLTALSLIAASLILATGSCAASSGKEQREFAGKRPYLADAASSQVGFSARFLGTSTLVIRDEDEAIIVDGFISRPSALQILLGRVRSDEMLVSNVLRRAGVVRANAVLVAHSHYDHAMDAVLVAELTGATLVGPPSMAHIASGQNFEGQFFTPVDRSTHAFGGFSVTFLITPHSPGSKFVGSIQKPLSSPAGVGQYLSDTNFSFLVVRRGVRILIVPSANASAELPEDWTADIVFLGVGGMGDEPEDHIAAYWATMVVKTGARRVVLIHWDDFTRPLSKPLQPFPAFMDDFGRVLKILTDLADASDVDLRLPHAFGRIPLND